MGLRWKIIDWQIYMEIGRLIKRMKDKQKDKWVIDNDEIKRKNSLKYNKCRDCVEIGKWVPLYLRDAGSNPV